MVHMCKTIISPSILFFIIFSKFWFFRLLGGGRGEWGGERGKNGPKQQKIVCHTPYLRNHSSYDCNLWYTFVKWYVQGFFFFFSTFRFFGLLVGWKGKKWSKLARNSVCRAPFVRNHTSYDFHLWYTSVKW